MNLKSINFLFILPTSSFSTQKKITSYRDNGKIISVVVKWSGTILKKFYHGLTFRFSTNGRLQINNT